MRRWVTVLCLIVIVLAMGGSASAIWTPIPTSFVPVTVLGVALEKIPTPFGLSDGLALHVQLPDGSTRVIRMFGFIQEVTK